MTTLRGQYPDGATQATVRSDENCAADAGGRIALPERARPGRHDDRRPASPQDDLTPCLTPGETVNVMTAAEYQAQS